MIYGVIIDKGEKYYTYLKKLFESIDNIQLNYIYIAFNSYLLNANSIIAI